MQKEEAGGRKGRSGGQIAVGWASTNVALALGATDDKAGPAPAFMWMNSA